MTWSCAEDAAGELQGHAPPSGNRSADDAAFPSTGDLASWQTLSVYHFPLLQLQCKYQTTDITLLLSSMQLQEPSEAVLVSNKAHQSRARPSIGLNTAVQHQAQYKAGQFETALWVAGPRQIIALHAAPCLSRGTDTMTQPKHCLHLSDTAAEPDCFMAAKGVKAWSITHATHLAPRLRCT